MLTHVLDQEFPGAIDARDFTARTADLLAPFGFDADNTIACAGVCRDEMARPLIDHVVQTWGEAFNFSSLAGMLTLGRTGFSAARGHAPRVDGRERFVFVAMPHIGIDPDGVLGRTRRRGQHSSTAACGALVAILEQGRAGALPTELDIDDIEQSLLRQRLRPMLPASTSELARVTITELTRVACDAILAELERLIAGSDMRGVDYGVFSGVQVHTPDGELVWPHQAYVVADDRRTDLEL